MSTAPDNELSRTPLRLWPGVLLAVLLVLVRFVLPIVAPDARFFGADAFIVSMLGGVVAAVGVILWWLFFSRAAWSERLSALALMIVALAATRLVVHQSIAGAGMGVLFFIFAIQGVSLALVVWAVIANRLPAGPRRASMVATILLACGAWALVRTGGITGEGDSDLHWRWSKTPEERLLAQAREAPVDAPPDEPKTVAAPPATELPGEPTAPTAGSAARTDPSTPPPDPAPAKAPPADPVRPRRAAEWPGFRGPSRDSIISGVRIDTDWTASPPVELWRRPVGPGWSSFAVDGDLVYTQEQRGDHEVVSCYRLSTGQPVWTHRDAVRFYESNAGAGPRATPTVHDGRVYTLGATGILNVLDSRTGAVVWSRNAATDAERKIPDWGIASSPLVVDDLVIVGVAGRLVAYDTRTGDPRWFGPTGGGGYSSPHLVTIDGVPQIVLLRGARTISVAPKDGSLLWDHSWELSVSIVQPALTPDGDILIAPGDATGMGGMGIRRLGVARGSAGWTVEERWTSRGLKPYFNDFVVHNGHAFGFDGSILACIDLEDGTRKWKGGRFGHGQLLLLADQDLLLVLSEDGELALVKATPDQFTEIARFPALDGKTWNHPVLVRDVLLVRNGQEMAAFRLPAANR